MEVDCIQQGIGGNRYVFCLNPCCDGSRLYGFSTRYSGLRLGLNPCCDGSRLYTARLQRATPTSVLILVVMEVDCILLSNDTEEVSERLNPCCDGSRLYKNKEKLRKSSKRVLILVVMEVDCMRLLASMLYYRQRLNPCCDGSRLYWEEFVKNAKMAKS